MSAFTQKSTGELAAAMEKVPAPAANALAPAQPKVIPPSIGRVLWYWRNAEAKSEPGAQPQACLCCYVHNDRLVNIAGFDCDGRHFAERSVPLRQPSDSVPEKGSFVEWMPYQIGAAAK